MNSLQLLFSIKYNVILKLNFTSKVKFRLYYKKLNRIKLYNKLIKANQDTYSLK